MRQPEPLFCAPPGSVAIPGTIAASWVLMHPDNVDGPNGHGATTNSHEPLAYVHLGTVPAALTDDGNVWIPTLHDLTPAGRMVRDIVIDNAVMNGGKERILHNVFISVPEAVDRIQHAQVN